jgi:hypothetical protein
MEKNTQEALPYAQRALTGRLKVLGKEHTDTRRSQKQVAELLRAEAKE